MIDEVSGVMRVKRCCRIEESKVRLKLYDVRQKSAYQLCFRHVYDVFEISDRVTEQNGVYSIIWDRTRDLIGVEEDSGNIPMVIEPAVALPRLMALKHDIVFSIQFQYHVNSADIMQFRLNPDKITRRRPNATHGVTLPADYNASENERVSWKRVGCAGVILLVGLLLMFIVCTAGSGYDCVREGNKIYGVESNTADVLEFMRRCEY